MPVQTSYPGVYIEERPSGVHTITGVATSVTAFVGAAGFGPVNRPVRVTSPVEYQRRFGTRLSVAEPMGYAVRLYFANGGAEAIIVRVAEATAAAATSSLDNSTAANPLLLEAASAGAWANTQGGAGLTVEIDHTTANPSDTFNATLRLRVANPATGNVELAAEEVFRDLSMSPASPQYVNLALERSELAHVDAASPAPGGTAHGTSTSATPVPLPVNVTPTSNVLRLSVDFGPPVDVVIAPQSYATAVNFRTAVTAALTSAGVPVTASVSAGQLVLESNATGPNSSVVVLPAPNALPAGVELGRDRGGTEVSGSAALRPVVGPAIFANGTDSSTNTPVGPADIVPAGGTGGIFALSDRPFPRFNLLVLPGVDSDDQVEVGAALAYCGRERAFLLVDTPPEAAPRGWVTDPPAVGGLSALGEHGAVYYPRVILTEGRPGGRQERLELPPTGAVAGVFARTDRDRGVWKAPAGFGAGMVGFVDLRSPTDDDLSGQLNPHGVNVLRSFPGLGTVVWGARTLRGDDAVGSEFKYVPIRRTTDFIASSLYRGTAFAVFEPNDPTLWGQLRLAVETFMRRLFLQGAFQESAKRTESDSFFVICDETVNPQAEIDLGRVNVVVGFAPLKPAEFVIVTITQISELGG